MSDFKIDITNYLDDITYLTGHSGGVVDGFECACKLVTTKSLFDKAKTNPRIKVITTEEIKIFSKKYKRVLIYPLGSIIEVHDCGDFWFYLNSDEIMADIESHKLNVYFGDGEISEPFTIFLTEVEVNELIENHGIGKLWQMKT